MKGLEGERGRCGGYKSIKATGLSQLKVFGESGKGGEMKERRRLRRRYLLAEVKVKPLRGGTAVRAQALNINRIGIGLYLKRALKKGTEAKVAITFQDRGRIRTTEEIKGTVRWSQGVGKNYAVGIRFDEKINKARFPVLTRCLEFSKKSK
jgi:hypothetical protein